MAAKRKPQEGMTISIPINIDPESEEPVEFVGSIQRISEDGQLTVKGRMMKTMEVVVPPTTHYKVVDN